MLGLSAAIWGFGVEVLLSLLKQIRDNNKMDGLSEAVL